LFAYSTISHLGFILLALSINSIESTQAFIFYLIQYSISNLNAFIILISIGFSLYPFVNDSDGNADADRDGNGDSDATQKDPKQDKKQEQEQDKKQQPKEEQEEHYKNLLDKNNSPIQLITQIKGYFYLNPVIALSLAITLFSFVGIPPLIGFFAKQMVLSAALDSGFVFLTLVAILTSVISAVYYLNVINQIFFFKPEYKLNPVFKDLILKGSIFFFFKKNDNTHFMEKITFKVDNIVLSSYLTITISTLTLILLLFIFTPQE